ncbi:MAG: response regulator, partial [Clostridiaceae bacterium]|nr:response regulator [Clostridiaceae bacterium]
MNLKVLIADDEIMIRKGLAAFPWAENGYELVGQAENGEEALLMTRVLSPDIIISDIKMP